MNASSFIEIWRIQPGVTPKKLFDVFKVEGIGCKTENFVIDSTREEPLFSLNGFDLSFGVLAHTVTRSIEARVAIDQRQDGNTLISKMVVTTDRGTAQVQNSHAENSQDLYRLNEISDSDYHLLYTLISIYRE